MRPTRADVVDLLKAVPLAFDEMTKDNVEEIRNDYSHPFADECHPGDVLWTIPRADGDLLVTVWFRDEGVRGGVGDNRAPTLTRGNVLPGLVLEHGAPGDEAYLDLTTGKPTQLTQKRGAKP